jgi:hypothetical protein
MRVLRKIARSREIGKATEDTVRDVWGCDGCLCWSWEKFGRLVCRAVINNRVHVPRKSGEDRDVGIYTISCFFFFWKHKIFTIFLL